MPTTTEPWLTRLKDLVVTNWPVKLTALVLSTVLWAAVAAEEPTTQLVPVMMQIEPPAGRTLRGTLPQIQAVYVGATRELIKLYASPPTIRRVLPDTLTGNEYTLVLSPEDLVVRRTLNVRAQDVEPRSITVLLDDVARRRLPVVPRLRIVPDSGYAIVGGIAVAPAAVTAVGPETAVRRLDSAHTVTVELSGVRDPVRRTVKLDTVGLGRVRFTPDEVEITADVVFIAERVLQGVPITLQGVPGFSSDPVAVLVTVRGPSTRLARLTRDSVVVVATASGADGPETVRLSVVAPDGLTGFASPDTAVVRRRRG